MSGTMLERPCRLAAAILAAAFVLSLLPQGAVGVPAARAATSVSPFVPATFPASVTETRALAFGDMDSDGDLDLVVGNHRECVGGGNYCFNVSDALYLNNGTADPFAGIAISGTGIDDGRNDTVVLALGDINGDGHLDIVAGNDGQRNQLFLNNGTTDPFAGVHETQIGSDGDNTAAIALGDVNDDGRLDLVVGNTAQPNQLYLNNGTTTPFVEAATLGAGATSIALGDVNGDSRLDLITAGSTIQLYLNNDTTTPFVEATTLGAGATSIALGDFNGDSRLDLITAGSTIQLYLNSGADVPFSGIASASVGTGGATDLALGDVNGDGSLDLVTADPRQATQLFLNSGRNALFDGTSSITVSQFSANSVALADVNGDGYLDLISGKERQSNQLFLNNGTARWFAEAGPTRISSKSNTPMALGDMDGDGRLDIVAGNFGQPYMLYLNDGRATPFANVSGIEFGPGQQQTVAVALGDLNSDGHLDLVAVNDRQPNRLYLNNRSSNPFEGVSGIAISDGQDTAQAVALGDMNGDDYIDLVVGNAGDSNKLYLHNGGSNPFDSIDATRFGYSAGSIVVGDVNGDGRLDVIALENGVNLYLNNRTADPLAGVSPTRISDSSERTTAVALADMNGDGNLDLIVGNRPYCLPNGACIGGENKLYLNNGTTTPFKDVRGTSISADRDTTFVVATGDMNGDGHLDLVAGNGDGIQMNKLYLNNGTPDPFAGVSGVQFRTIDPGINNGALADLNSDGSLDFIAANLGFGGDGLLYLNRSANKGMPNNPPQVAVRRPGATMPGGTNQGGFPAAGRIISNTRVIHIPYTLIEPEGDPTIVRAEYSLDGGGSWRPAITASGTITSLVSTRPGTDEHDFPWDIAASGLYGQSDNVVFRILATSSLRPRLSAVSGPFQYVEAAASTFPFRVRGTIARVVSLANPGGEGGALVYRLPAGQTRGAQLLLHRLSREPLPSDSAGYVPSRDPVLPGDRLVAVLPVSSTGKLTFAYTSASPTDAGLEVTPITAATLGTQTLTVAPANPLLLLNLDVGLEWDAREDTVYLDALKARLRRASEILYDWSDGQIALGQLTLYHNRERWEHTLDPQGAVVARGVDLRIYASNAVRPSATQGGIVNAPTTVTYPAAPGGPRSATYEPGYVRIGAGWSSDGEPGADSAEDWARALAHELGHFAFFLDETYLGRAGDLLVPVEGCPSPMADPYIESASEFRPAADWPEACRNTLQYLGTGLSEWELIKQRYDRSVEQDGFSFSLNAPTRAGANPGPAALPMAVTTFADGTQAPPVAVSSRAYGVIPPDRGRYTAAPGARAILFRGGDGQPLDLGAPIGGQLQVRGMAPGDRLCVFDPEQELLGCGLTATGLALVASPGWRPTPQVTPLTQPGPTGATTMTLRVEVPATTVTTGTLPADLRLRLYPREGALTPVDATLPLVDGVYRAEIALPEVVEEGLLQLWVDEPGQRREAVVDYSLGGNPAPKKKPPRRSRRNAPAVSPDGQATLFSEETSFGPGQFFALQSTSSLPAPPPWATVVGQGYRLLASDPAMLARPDRPLALSLGYAEGSVPPGLEGDVRVIFHDGGAWRELPTRVNTARNEAAVVVQPTPGVYALVTSLRLRVGRTGWSMLYAYPGASQPLPEALIASARSYNAVYGYDPSDADDPWKLYSPLAPAWVNDLPGLENGASYWLHTTTPVTLSLRLPEPEASIQQAQDLLPPPPMTAYGVLGPLWEVPVRAGLTVEALIDGEVCGSTTTRALGGGQVGFALDVLARGTPGVTGCGAPGVAVRLVFRDGPTEVGAIDTVWGHEAPAELRPTRVYLAAIHSGGGAGAAVDAPGEMEEGSDEE